MIWKFSGNPPSTFWSFPVKHTQTGIITVPILFPNYHFLACLLIYLYSFNPIFHYDFIYFLFFCKLSNHLSINHLSIDWLIDWLWCETWILWWSPELWDLFYTSFDRVVSTRSELYYDFMYRIIILCFSYLATWLPFLNKPIDWLIHSFIDNRITRRRQIGYRTTANITYVRYIIT